MEDTRKNRFKGGFLMDKCSEIDDGKKDFLLTFDREKTGLQGQIIITEDLYKSFKFTYEEMKEDIKLSGGILYGIGALILEGASNKSSGETNSRSEKSEESSTPES